MDVGIGAFVVMVRSLLEIFVKLQLPLGIGSDALSANEKQYTPFRGARLQCDRGWTVRKYVGQLCEGLPSCSFHLALL